MSYTLRLIFEGVCAFVPDKPFFTNGLPGQPTSMSVLIPDLRRAQVGATKRMRDAHFPVLSFELENLVRAKSTRFVDLVFREDLAKNEHGLCILRNEVVTVDSIEGRPQNFQFASTVPLGQVPANMAELSSVFWLPRIAEIQPGYEKAMRPLNPKRFKLVPPELIGAVQIDRGFFRCLGFNRDDSGDPRIWRFAKDDDGAGVWNRVVGNRFALELFDLTMPVSLLLDARTIDPQPTQLTFFPRQNESLVEVEVSNLEPEQIFADSGLHIEASPDPDFEEFYGRISSNRNPTPPVIPNLKRRQSGLGDVRKPCAPAAFSGFA